MRGPLQRLEDILAAIAVLKEYEKRGKERFSSDLDTQCVILVHLQRLGEAAWKLPDSVTVLAPSIPWEAIAGLRHVIVHDYFKIDLDKIWETVEHDLATLERNIRALSVKLQ